MFWKFFPLILEIVRYGGSILVERYKSARARDERMKAEAEALKAKEESNVDTVVVPSKQTTQ